MVLNAAVMSAVGVTNVSWRKSLNVSHLVNDTTLRSPAISVTLNFGLEANA